MFQHIQLFKAITAVKWEALQNFNERMTFIKKTWHFQSNFALHIHVLQICIMHILVKYSELWKYSGDRSYIWILERNMDKFWPPIKRDQVYFQIGSWWKPVIQSFRPKDSTLIRKVWDGWTGLKRGRWNFDFCDYLSEVGFSDDRVEANISNANFLP